MNVITKSIMLLVSCSVLIFISGCTKNSVVEDDGWDFLEDDYNWEERSKDYFLELWPRLDDKLYATIQGDGHTLKVEGKGTLSDDLGFRLKASFGSEFHNYTNLVIDLTAKYNKTNHLYTVWGTVISSQESRIILAGTADDPPNDNDDEIMLTSGTNTINYVGDQIGYYD